MMTAKDYKFLGLRIGSVPLTSRILHCSAKVVEWFATRLFLDVRCVLGCEAYWRQW